MKLSKNFKLFVIVIVLFALLIPLGNYLFLEILIPKTSGTAATSSVLTLGWILSYSIPAIIIALGILAVYEYLTQPKKRN